MKEFKKLFQAKRILALVLALAMTVTMLPMTAYAAPSEGLETITDSEPADDTVTDVQTTDDADVQTSDDGADAGDAASVDALEDNSADAEGTAAVGGDASENNSTDAEDADTEAADIPVNAEGDETTENETRVYEIVDNSSSSDKTAEYSGSPQSFYTALNNIVIKRDGAQLGTISSLFGAVASWVKKGETTPLGSDPTEVGNYQLLVTIPKDYDGGKNDETKAAFDFEITKQVLSVNVTSINVAPGTKAADISYSAMVYSTGNDSLSASYNKAEPDANKESKLLVTAVAVKDAITNKELGNDEVLVKNGDYAVTLHFAFTDKAAAEDKQKFEMPEDQVVDINMTDLVTTNIKWKYTDKYISEHQIPVVDADGKPELDADGKPVYEIQPFTYTYTGSVQAPVEGTDYEAHIYSSEVVETKEDGTKIYKELEGELKQVWYDSYGNELDQVPVKAGEYSFKLYYAGEEGIYAESYSDYTSSDYGYYRIPVTIDTVSLEIVPTLENLKYNAGTTAYEVLAKVDYEVYKTDETAENRLGARFDTDEKFDKNRFWGTSVYDRTRTQPYQPLFGVYEPIEVSTDDVDADGNPVTETKYREVDQDTVLIAGVPYRLMFTGDKIVYAANGDFNEYDYCPINDYNSVNLTNPDSLNYTVDTEYVHYYALEISVAATTEIKVDDIKLNENNTKVYDGKPLFADKAAYKKAVVKVGETTVAEGTADSLTYRWYRSYGSTQQLVVDKDGNPVLDADGNPTYETVQNWSSYGTTDIPTNAGIHKLVVSYYDKTHENDSAKAEVIFEIKQRLIKVVPSGEYEVYTGVTVEQFRNMTDIDYSIVPVEEGVEIAELSNWEIDEDYDLYWDVEKYNAETKEWSALSSSYVFAEEDKDNVRLAVGDFDPYSSNYTDREEKETTAEGGTTSTTYVKYHETLPITVNKMGAAELTVTTDLSKLEEKSKVYDGVEFDVSAALKNGLIKITTGTTDVTEKVLPEMEGFWRYGYEDCDKPVDVGTYTYYLVFGGNEEYKAFTQYDYSHENFVYATDITYEITKAEITVTPSIKEVVEAGIYGYSAYDQYATKFDVPVEKDKEAFTYQNSYDKYGYKKNYWPAVNGNITFNVLDAKGNAVYYSQKLKALETYTVVFGSASLNYPYSRNYTLKAGEPVSFTTVHAKSQVVGFNLESSSNVILKLNDVTAPTEENGYTHTVTAVNAIPYVYEAFTVGGNSYKPGNYIGARIIMPAEYSSLGSINPMYENSIKKAGGFVYALGTNFIEVGFDAKEDAKKEFDIRWVDGYVEHFVLDFAKADFAADLRATATPKSIAFNNAAKKMVVGGSQQLDVKLTKAQMSDTIHLSYKADPENVLCVDENGYVTALKPGKATVTVYSSKLSIDENGVRTWVDTTPAKQAKLTINVSNVTAPKIKSVTPLDNRVTVSWAAPIDGYRSEIYVLPGKNVKADVFEKAIASMNNEAWQGIFATAPVYVSAYDYDSITKLYSRTLYDLSSQETYTVYVRNVSAIRNLNCGHGDGCQVSEAHAGAVKSVVTTKSQVVGLRFDKEKIEDSDYGSYYSTAYTTVALSKKNVNLPLDGLFYTQGEDNTADAADTTWKTLPLSKTELNNYAAPKLVYYVGEARDYPYGSGYMGQSYSYYDENTEDWEMIHLYTTPLAAIKNGKLTLKGVGKVAVVARDVNTGRHAVIFVTITADADGIKGKTVKMQVGQSISLYDMVTYSEGKKTLIGSYYNRGIIVDDALKETFANDDRFELLFNGTNDIRVKAVQAGGRALSFKVSDRVVNANKGAKVEATVKLTVTALEPVKNLKTSFVTDQFADLEFSHPGNADAFRIQVTDARGNILQSKYVQNNYSGYNYYYNTATKAYVYTYRISRLTQKSKYNVTVTALYGDTAAKVAKKSFTTTLLPASYNRLDSYIKDNPAYTGGVDITLPNRGWTSLNGESLLSGNTYTLAINENDGSFNRGAKYAKTDALTWTSTNNKVVTVKANAGSYTAALKAVGAGSAYIEVKSKITKAVIARWRVDVNPVCSAYVIGYDSSDNYYGDNEQLGKNTVGGSTGGTGNSGSQGGTGGTGGTEPAIRPVGTTRYLNLGNQASTSTYVSVQENEFQWVSFTAPETGDYWFYSNNNSGDPKAWFFYSYGKDYVENSLDEYSSSSSLDTWSESYGYGYNDDGSEDDGTDGPYIGENNFSKIVSLSQGETIYIAVGRYGLSNSLTTDVYVEKYTISD